MTLELKSWHDYFVGNGARARARLREDSRGEADRLDETEKRRVEKSVAAFQLGEHSEGRHLLRCAEEFARETGDEYVVKITRLFIAEEQKHARLLKRFMELHRIPLIKAHWTDAVFRRLRKHVGFASSVTVLITAEIISLVYYRALKNCTGSKLLREICDEILSDEEAHVRYESELLAHLRGAQPRLWRFAASFLHRVLFCGTVVVYHDHRKVLAGGGYGFFRFRKSCRVEFARYFRTEKYALKSRGVSRA